MDDFDNIAFEVNIEGEDIKEDDGFDWSDDQRDQGQNFNNLGNRKNYDKSGDPSACRQYHVSQMNLKNSIKR